MCGERRAQQRSAAAAAAAELESGASQRPAGSIATKKMTDAAIDGDLKEVPDSAFLDFDDSDDASSNSSNSSDDDGDGDVSSFSDDGKPAEEVEKNMLQSLGLTGNTNSDSDDDGVDQEPTKKPATAVSTSANVTTSASTKALSLAPDVRRAGQRARARLEEERSKRKEIVRIDDDDKDDLLIQKKSAGSLTLKPDAVIGRKKTSAASKRKRKRANKSSAPKDFCSALGEQEDGSIIDTWMPDHQSVCMDGRSNIVRVHGLPYGCKPEEIRRFFSGLIPTRILILVSHKQRIVGWDCSDSVGSAVAATTGSVARKRRRGGAPTAKASTQDPLVKRYSPGFRVFVQFDSAPSAEMAMNRSGEALFTSNAILLAQPERESNVGKVGAAVFISPISRGTQAFLKKRQLAIDAVKGEFLHDTLRIVENTLPRYVKRSLWAFAWSCLRIDQKIKPYKNEDSDDDENIIHSVSDAFAILEKETESRFPKDADAYRELAKAYNSICDLYFCIEESSSMDMALLGQNPCLLEDPICRLIDAALTYLSCEAEKLDTTLRHARETLNKE